MKLQIPSSLFKNPQARARQGENGRKSAVYTQFAAARPRIFEAVFNAVLRRLRII